MCKYRIHRNHDEPGSDVEDRHTGEGTSGTLEQAEQDEMSVADTPAASTSRSGLARPASLGYGDIDGDDVAPLLGKSAPAASWLSGGQLPSEGTTWLGYGESPMKRSCLAYCSRFISQSYFQRSVKASCGRWLL